jgi:NADH-quinone oxidoreductase subunit I
LIRDGRVKLPKGIRDYFRNIYESVTTISVGLWITFKTAFFERKVTLQYPSHDVMEGGPRDAALPSHRSLNPTFDPLLGANQRYRGPLNPRVADRYRGLLGYDEPKCISCLMCAQACPIGVITVKGVKIEGRKTKAPVRFIINYAKCMFCGLCVEICPTDAIFFTRQFEGATYDYRTLIREFISGELREERLKLAEETGKKAEGKMKEKEDEGRNL